MSTFYLLISVMDMVCASLAFLGGEQMLGWLFTLCSLLMWMCALAREEE